MNYIGRRLYYEKATGNIIVDTGERSGWVAETTVEQDIAMYDPLSGLNPSTYDHVQLEYGRHAEDFATCIGFRVNPETEAVEFLFDDPDEEQPVFEKPMAEQVAELKADKDALYQQLAQTNTDLAAFMDYYFSQTP